MGFPTFGEGAPPILEPILGLGCSLGVRAFDPWPCEISRGRRFLRLPKAFDGYRSSKVTCFETPKASGVWHGDPRCVPSPRSLRAANLFWEFTLLTAGKTIKPHWGPKANPTISGGSTSRANLGCPQIPR